MCHVSSRAVTSNIQILNVTAGRADGHPAAAHGQRAGIATSGGFYRRYDWHVQPPRGMGCLEEPQVDPCKMG